MLPDGVTLPDGVGNNATHDLVRALHAACTSLATLKSDAFSCTDFGRVAVNTSDQNKLL